MWKPIVNAFCATGEGGGVDPSCSPDSGGSSAESQFRGILDRIGSGSVSSNDIEEFKGAVTKLSKEKIGKLLKDLSIHGGFKSKKDAANKAARVLEQQLEMHIKADYFR